MTVDRTSSALTRFANSFIHQNVADDRPRCGCGCTSTAGRRPARTDRADADGAAWPGRPHAGAAARLAPPDRGGPGSPPPAPVAGTGTGTTATAGRRPGRPRAGACATSSTRPAAWRRPGTAHRPGPAPSPTRPGSPAAGEAAEAGWRRSPATTARGRRRPAGVRPARRPRRRRARRARRGQGPGRADPVELPPGRYEVVLEPTAVADMLQLSAVHGFNGKAVNERRSFVASASRSSTRPSRWSTTRPPAASACRTTPRARRRAALRWSTTGSAPRRARPATAAEAGASSTGHALPGGGAWGAVPASLHCCRHRRASARRGRRSRRRPSSAELVAGVERGCSSPTSGTPGCSTPGRW